MHIKHATETSAEGQTGQDQHAAKAKQQNAVTSLQDFSAAANAVMAAELLQLSLPVLRSVQLVRGIEEVHAHQALAADICMLA